MHILKPICRPLQKQHSWITQDFKDWIVVAGFVTDLQIVGSWMTTKQSTPNAIEKQLKKIILCDISSFWGGSSSNIVWGENVRDLVLYVYIWLIEQLYTQVQTIFRFGNLTTLMNVQLQVKLSPFWDYNITGKRNWERWQLSPLPMQGQIKLTS
jgi:hypothetical protein